MKMKSLLVAAFALLMAGCNNNERDGLYTAQSAEDHVYIEIESGEARITTSVLNGWRQDARFDVQGYYTVKIEENKLFLKNKDTGNTQEFALVDKEKDGKTFTFLNCVDCEGIDVPKTQRSLTKTGMQFIKLSEKTDLQEAIDETEQHDKRFEKELSTFEGAKAYEISRCAYNGIRQSECECVINIISKAVTPEIYHKIVRRDRLDRLEQVQLIPLNLAARNAAFTCRNR